MKIAIDGFNTGYLQGTGIATHAHELAKLLHKSGHSVYSIYGLTDSVTPERFARRLMTRGEVGRKNVAAWLPWALRHLPRHLAGKALQLDEMPLGRLGPAAVGRFPFTNRVFNAPALFRTAQFYAGFSHWPLDVALPPDARPDLFHLTLPLPLRMTGIPNIVTLHDVIPLALPGSTDVNLWLYRKIMEMSLASADLIFAVSESAKRDAMRILGIGEEKIHVTYQAVDIDASYREKTKEEGAAFLDKNYGLKPGSYFLFYGAVEPKKNVLRLLQAMEGAQTSLPLLIVGRNAWLSQDVDDFLARQDKTGAGRFRRLPYVPHETLMFLLKGARALLFPSLYEGFGLPVLEAMSMGTPVVTSRCGALAEVGGNAAQYIDPYDISDIAAGIDRLASDDAYVAELVGRGHAQAAKFSPSNYLERMEKGYARVMRQG
jgi:glycosyltransferase involved in cell wall biosynthesis